tara:strand:- start:398 stop:940 length:543 start_codon:yes stop_codon:yes gene_type:complete
VFKPEDILNFWFHEIEPAQHWKKDIEFDRMISKRFSEVHHQASRGELYDWRKTGRGRLAEIIVLDQFSRNMYRDLPLSFAYDAQALILAQEAVARQVDTELTATERVFLYLPYMHSESLLIHEIALELYTKNAIAENLDFEIKHKNIIARFGRYPHRNNILGRESTAEELEFLKQPGSSF